MIVLYNDDLFTYIEENKEDIIASIKEEDVYPTEKAIEEEAQAWINADWDYFKDAICDWDEVIPYDYILIEADLGLWYGRRKFKAKTASLYEAITKASEDYNLLYFKNRRATLSLKAAHHDGVNNFKFYKVKNNKKRAIKYSDLYRG